MLSRARFSLSAGALLCAVPTFAGRADAAVALTDSGKPHVHGANGVTKIPEGRPIEWKIEVLDGPEFKLSTYRGKAVFVNVFATWCGPCRMEQPDVVAFAEAHADDTAVVGLDIHEEDDDVRAYRKKFAIPYPIAMWRASSTIPAIFARNLIYPTTVVFRPDSTFSCAWMGNRNRAWFERERDAALQPAG